MMTPAQPPAIEEAQSGWRPSKHVAEDQAGALKLRGATGAWVAPLAIV